jgi:SAM-dependent methyltransferase
MSVELDQIIPWGRSRHEYELMFSLTPDDLRGRILGCGDGPASFNAEMTEAGYPVVSVDPCYAYPGSEIAGRFEANLETVIKQVCASFDKWNWDYHRNPDGLLANRRNALDKFLADYEAGRRAGRYQVASLPKLPFSDGCFDLALCSHLLFLYSDQLSEEFHVQSVRELCRVAREVRIFPLLALSHQISPHIAAVRARVAQAGWASEIVRVNYEFQKGGDKMLRILRP